MTSLRRSRPEPGVGSAAGLAGTRKAQLVDGGVDLGDDTGHRHDVEDALAALEQVDDLLTGVGEHGAALVDDQVGRGHVVAAGAQAGDGPAGRSQGDPGVEQALDDLDLEQVASTSSRRWVPLPRASEIEGRSRSVRAQ